MFPLTRTSRHLLKYIKINDQNHERHDENVVLHEAATTPEQIECSTKLSVLWKEYRAGTRSVDGLLRACFLHVGLIFVSVTSLPYNRQIMQTRIIYCKTAYFMAIVPVSDM